jgi:nicotinamide-nucleotide amidase
MDDVVEQLDFVQIDEGLVSLGVEALRVAQQHNRKIVCVESCTGGLVATVLSEAPGAVDYFDGAFVTYTADQKCSALNIDPDLLHREGAVSAPVAAAMAEAALRHCNADVAVAVTGVAGPDRDEKGNPVGLVFLARASADHPTFVERKVFGDKGRSKIRYEAAAAALRLITAMQVLGPSGEKG